MQTTAHFNLKGNIETFLRACPLTALGCVFGSLSSFLLSQLQYAHIDFPMLPLSIFTQLKPWQNLQFTGLFIDLVLKKKKLAIQMAFILSACLCPE